MSRLAIHESVKTIATIEAECLDEKRSLSPEIKLHIRISPFDEPLMAPISGCKNTQDIDRMYLHKVELCFTAHPTNIIAM